MKIHVCFFRIILVHIILSNNIFVPCFQSAIVFLYCELVYHEAEVKL